MPSTRSLRRLVGCLLGPSFGSHIFSSRRLKFGVWGCGADACQHCVVVNQKANFSGCFSDSKHVCTSCTTSVLSCSSAQIWVTPWFCSAFPLFWCFFHEWDGYIVNGFFSVLTVFTAFISEFASAVDSVSARGVLFWKLTVCSVPFLCLTSGLAQSAIFLTDVKWSCVILHPSKIDSVHVLRVDLLLKRSLTII